MQQNVRGAAFVRALSAENLDALRRYGPVKPVIDKAAAIALDSTMPELGTHDIRTGAMPQHATGPDERGGAMHRPRLI